MQPAAADVDEPPRRREPRGLAANAAGLIDRPGDGGDDEDDQQADNEAPRGAKPGAHSDEILGGRGQDSMSFFRSSTTPILAQDPPMTRRAHSILIVLLMVAAAGVASGQATASGDAALAPLAWLVGTWTGEGKTPDGRAATNEITYAWTADRKAIQYSLARRAGGVTDIALAGLCGWHPVRKRLVLWEMDSQGNLTEGAIAVVNGVQTHDEVIYGADGSTLPVRAEVRRKGADAFVFRALVEKGGAWVQVFETTYVRSSKF
jgi:hypothetical protein